VALTRRLPVFPFDRTTQQHGYTVENINAIAVPALILTGDRDPFCTVEEEAVACGRYRLASSRCCQTPAPDHPPRPCGPRSDSSNAYDRSGAPQPSATRGIDDPLYRCGSRCIRRAAVSARSRVAV
jgi:hypothetical protein